MSSIENKPVNSLEPEAQNPEPDAIALPQTLAQRLRNEGIRMARDFRGTSLRLSVPIAISTIEYTTIFTNGGDQETAATVGLGSAITIIVIGEAFLWDRISRRLPWFKVSYLSSDFHRRATNKQ